MAEARQPGQSPPLSRSNYSRFFARLKNHVSWCWRLAKSKDRAFPKSSAFFFTKSNPQRLQVEFTDFLFVLIWPTWPQLAHLRCVPALFLPLLLGAGVEGSAPLPSAPVWSPSMVASEGRFFLRRLALRLFSSLASSSSSLLSWSVFDSGMMWGGQEYTFFY